MIDCETVHMPPLALPCNTILDSRCVGMSCGCAVPCCPVSLCRMALGRLETLLVVDSNGTPTNFG